MHPEPGVHVPCDATHLTCQAASAVLECSPIVQVLLVMTAATREWLSGRVRLICDRGLLILAICSLMQQDEKRVSWLE